MLQIQISRKRTSLI